jgi:hypothetical protein
LEDKEVDNWANQTDPLLSRHFPNSAESARIEEEDMRRAVAEGISTAPFPTYHRPRKLSRLRIVFIALAIIAVLAMLVDAILLSFVFNHSHHTSNAPVGPPSLTLSSNQASNGQTVKVTISHFTPQTKVLLTHDIQEPVQTTSGSAIILIGSDGNATTSVIIDDTWGPGFHLLFAEDISTRYTASATLQIINAGPTPPPRLVIQNTSIDLGTAYQGANTIQNVTLLNAGGGSITWTASSSKAWLQISPPQGMFSKSQTIVIAAQRTGLKPGNYSGTITFTSNVGNQPPAIHVSMTVKQLPPNAGPVLSLTPAVLSFVTSDGNPQTQAQNLTISNPGSQTLNWSVSLSDSSNQSSQNALFHMLGSKANWLSTNLSSGTIQPGSSASILVRVQSQSLLPGTYLGTLVFTGHGVIDSPQTVSISLTVQPHCGLVISPAGLSFIAVQGQGNPSNQALNLSLTNSCDGSTVTWHAIPSNSWLAVAPASGQLRGAMSSVASVGINLNGLAPRTYYSQITFVVGQSTQTVAVQLVVQPTPPPAEPIMSASPLNLNFSNTQGQPNPSGQIVTIANNGSGPLKWNTSVNQLASSWLYAAPSGGTVAPKQTGQVTVSVDTSLLTPGTYVGQVILDGKDIGGHEASGSPEIVTINLVVQPPCVLTRPSSSALTFSYTQGGTAPSPQNVTFTGTGSCAWPLSWITTPSPLPAWLSLGPSSGSIKASGDISTMQVSVNTTGLQPGTYTQPISISATDSSGAHAQGSPQTLTVTLTVLQPCSLQPLPASLTFTAVQGQPPSPSTQTFSISETGGCSYPVSWTAVGDPGSSTWLSIFPTNGSDGGSGSTVTVTISSTNMPPGTYNGQITVSATDSNGVVVQGTPQPIPVTLTITASISGTIFACTGSPPSCSSSQPLAGATVTLVSNGNAIQTVISDASGNYTFTQVAFGTYTITVSGSGNGGQYNGISSPLTVSGNIVGFDIDVFSG